MFSFVLRNIQAIKEAEIAVCDNAITEFTGDNSNGKSILSKVIQYLTSGDIMNKDIREALIKDGEDQGIVLIQYDKKQLAICICKELRDSYIIFCPDSDQPKRIVKRYFNEKGLDKILDKFGFKIYSKGEICLQLAPTYGSIPFITTNGATNFDIIEDMKVDKVAEEFIDTFEKITYPLIRTRVKNLQIQIDEKRKSLSMVDTYDWAAYGKLATEIKRVYNATKGYIPYVPEKAILCKKTNATMLEPYVPKKAEVFNVAPIASTLNNARDILSSLREVRNGKCPTCGRNFIE